MSPGQSLTDGTAV